MAEDEKAAVVFVFPFPDNQIEFMELVKKAKEFFANNPDVRVLAAIRDAANDIENMFEEREKEK